MWKNDETLKLGVILGRIERRRRLKKHIPAKVIENARKHAAKRLTEVPYYILCQLQQAVNTYLVKLGETFNRHLLKDQTGDEALASLYQFYQEPTQYNKSARPIQESIESPLVAAIQKRSQDDPIRAKYEQLYATIWTVTWKVLKEAFDKQDAQSKDYADYDKLHTVTLTVTTKEELQQRISEASEPSVLELAKHIANKVPLKFRKSKKGSWLYLPEDKDVPLSGRRKRTNEQLEAFAVAAINRALGETLNVEELPFVVGSAFVDELRKQLESLRKEVPTVETLLPENFRNTFAVLKNRPEGTTLIKRLGTLRAKILRLKCEQRLSIPQIARKLHLHPNTIKYHLRKIRATFKTPSN